MLAREYSVLGCLLHERCRFRAHDARGLPHDAPLRQKSGHAHENSQEERPAFSAVKKPRPCRACSRRGVLYIDNGGALRADMDCQCDGLRDSARRGYKRDGRALRRLSGNEKKAARHAHGRRGSDVRSAGCFVAVGQYSRLFGQCRCARGSRQECQKKTTRRAI